MLSKHLARVGPPLRVHITRSIFVPTIRKEGALFNRTLDTPMNVLRHERRKVRSFVHASLSSSGARERSSSYGRCAEVTMNNSRYSQASHQAVQMRFLGTREQLGAKRVESV